MDDKVIITCAVTGAIHTPSMSPYLPVTPDEIAEAAIGAAEAGAAVIHLHARDPQTGKPKEWPLRNTVAFWSVTLKDVRPGAYTLFVRSVDLNGFAQPQPRPQPGGEDHRFHLPMLSS